MTGSGLRKSLSERYGYHKQIAKRDCRYHIITLDTQYMISKLSKYVDYFVDVGRMRRSAIFYLHYHTLYSIRYIIEHVLSTKKICIRLYSCSILHTVSDFFKVHSQAFPTPRQWSNHTKVQRYTKGRGRVTAYHI